MGVLGWKGDRAKQDGVISRCQKWQELAVLPPLSFNFGHALCASETTVNQPTVSWFGSFGFLGACWDDVCQVTDVRGASSCVGWSEPRRERERERKRKRNREEWEERQTGGDDRQRGRTHRSPMTKKNGAEVYQGEKRERGERVSQPTWWAPIREFKYAVQNECFN